VNAVIAIIGAGGHAKCVYECFYLQDQQVFGFFDDDSSKNGLSIIDGVRVLGTPDAITRYNEIKSLFIAIGDNRTRLDKNEFYKGQGYFFPNAVHAKAYISTFAVVGEGNFIMGPAVINPGSVVGNYCIINTSATVGHDCLLEDAVQIGPGVNLAGGTTVKEGAFIGIGARVGPGVTIGPWSVVCAGSVVLSDLPGKTFSSGIPARVVRHLE
jgi:UDP-perosamine 4-acetyltransferase